MLNLSEGGAFIKTSSKVQQGFQTTLFFKFLNISLALPATVVHVRKRGVKGLGLQFRHTDETEAQLRQITETLRTFGVQQRLQTPDSSFHFWATRLMRTGKGLLPELVDSSIQNPEPVRARPKLHLVPQAKIQNTGKRAA